MATIHDITNTRGIVDEFRPDLRRARVSSISLIPTNTGSATAITHIFPELKGRLNGHAIRAPLANAFLTDCAIERQRRSSAKEVHSLHSSLALPRYQKQSNFL